MRVRRAEPRDFDDIVDLARRLELAHAGMDEDIFWVAEDSGEVVGIVGFRKHPDCMELCSLGVDPAFRGRGVGRALVEALTAEAPGDIHLATVIPEYFQALGFTRAPAVPASFVEKRKTPWCEGCRHDLCAVMVRKRP
ncbi:MAG: GNAT family N-acetyltransferase [Candidatus Aminicenantes bacterium]